MAHYRRYMPEGWVEMDDKKSYYVWRIGKSGSNKVTEGNVYVVSIKRSHFDEYRRWVISDCDNKGDRFYPTLKINSKVWKVLSAVEDM